MVISGCFRLKCKILRFLVFLLLSGDESESSREEGEEDDGEDDDVDAVSNVRDKLSLPIVEPHRMDHPFFGGQLVKTFP